MIRMNVPRFDVKLPDAHIILTFTYEALARNRYGFYVS